MMKRSLIRADIAEAIYQKIGLSRNESADFVGTILDEISNKLESGKNVKITSFGSFTVRNKNERMGRNPKTGQEVAITPRRVLSFRPSHILRDKVNDSD
jgi:integration host factor subunit alpha